MAAELFGGAFLSAFLQVLFDRLVSGDVLDFFRGKEPIVKLLTELRTTLYSAGLLLNDAEEKLIKDPKVRMWLDELKEAVFDADDLVYKIDTEALRDKMEGDSRSSFTTKLLKRFKLIPTSLESFDKAIKPEIEHILGSLKVLLAPSNNPGLKIVEIKKLPERLPAPLVEDSDVYGRDAEKEAIIQLLLSDDASGEPLSVIPIVGMGGIGKTTLAQLVYNDARVIKNFDCKAWVTDGEDKFDLLKAMKIVIKDVTSAKCEIEDVYGLQIKLKEALRGKKFLVVLDDIWDNDPHNWDVLKSSFISGLRESKIIVTTRSQDVASIMKTRSIYHLGRISNDDGWRLFAKHASIDEEHSDEYSDLQAIGREIVDKCKGLPLAIKSLGSLLRQEKGKRQWSKILNTNTWELYERSKIGILPALWLSYYYLSSYLKPCFAYCGLFPKDYKFEKQDLILLWMAEGFLHSKDGKKMEDVGEEYFQELISRSFFQPSASDSVEFVMHDLMHDLAHFVSSEFIFKADDANLSNRSKTIRYCSYTKGCCTHPMKFEGLSKAKGLRTILALPLGFHSGVCNEKSISLLVEHLFKFLQSTGGCLRVLSFSNYDITKLPDSIGDLKYLRYLDLSLTYIEELPDTVCNLYNLETLLLIECVRLTRLPENIGNLINLRHLNNYRSPLEVMPPQIGRIKTLQTIRQFVLGRNSGSHIRLLKELQDLSGTLEIMGLENVVDVKDVLEADLKNKKFLRELILRWDDSHVPDDSQKQEVLCALEPHANLEKLCILGYKSTSSPNWVGDRSFSNIVEVWLINCENCCFLQPLGQLPSLKHLELESFHGVERITSEFYSGDGSPVGTKPFRSLESLKVSKMSKLQEWSFIKGEVEGGVFPRLKKLKLIDCPRLKVSLPDYLPSLKKITIRKCDQLLPLVPRGQQMDTAFPSLQTMIIHRCNGQELFLEGGLPSSLKELRITICKNLTALDKEAFQRLTSLEKLQIWSCNKLRCLPKGLPSSLSHLSIRNCDLLTPRLQTKIGEDWPIIAHIPSVYIPQDSDDDDDDNPSRYIPLDSDEVVDEKEEEKEEEEEEEEVCTS